MLLPKRTTSGTIITMIKIIKIVAPDQPITVAKSPWSETDI